MTALLEFHDVTIRTPSGRVLLEGLNLSLARARVALVGRNGVGKSSPLAVMAGAADASAGRVTAHGKPHYVPQALAERPASIGARSLSHGERQRRALSRMRLNQKRSARFDTGAKRRDAP